MAPITFMASTNRETRDRGRHRAEVVRSNIKVTTQTRSTQYVVTQSGSVGVLSPLPTDSADSCWRVLC